MLSLALVRVLTQVDLARYAALSGAALAVGAALGAGLPAAVAAAHARGEHAGADRFAFRAAFIAAAVMIPALALYGAMIAEIGGAVALAGAGAVVVASSVGTSRLLGLERRRGLAIGRTTEAVIRLAVGLAGGLVAGAPGAIAGIIAGTGVFALIGFRARPPKGTDALARRLAGDALVLTAVFGLTAAAGSLDVLILPFIVGSTPALGAYAATALLARAPYFVAAALVATFYPSLSARRSPGEAGEAVRSTLLVAIPGALLVAALPEEIARAIVPYAWTLGPELLAALALAGLGAGVFALGTVLAAAAGQPRRSIVLAFGGIVVASGLLAVTARISLALAAASAGSTLLVFGTAALVTYAPWRRASAGALLSILPIAALAALPLALQPVAGRVEAVWLATSAVVGLFILRGFLHQGTRAQGPLRVLHLAYEDPSAPGSGGGSLRTAEIASRLVAGGDVRWTAVCRRFPGARPRLDDGVAYKHIGIPGPWFAANPKRAAIGYFVALPFAFPILLLRYRPDVIVEDFGAPISTFGIGRLTRRPVVGIVQWCNAVDKAREYGLPFAAIERFGLAAHRRLIAVSEDLARDLRVRAPQAEVVVIGNGVDDAAFGELPEAPAGIRSGDIAFLGRLECAQKGLDLLIDAYARIATDVTADLVLAGDGADRAALLAQSSALGVGERVRFIGRVDGPARFGFLAAASIVAMPSRFETFGIVAAEALAVGTPVVAFDIPALREIVLDGQTGVLVQAFDVEAYANAMRSLVNDRDRREGLRPACRAIGASLRWSDAAAATLDVLREAVGARARSLPAAPSTVPSQPHFPIGGQP